MSKIARAVLICCLALATRAIAAPSPLDLVIVGGMVVDGTGAPWFRADVGVSGDTIVAVGDLSSAPAKRRVDARGLVVSPGFIDMLGQSEYNLLVDNRCASKITQGITTELTGEGASIAPLNARMITEGEEVWRRYGVRPDWTSLRGYWKALDRARPAINLGTFVGAGGVRDLVMGRKDGRPTEAELKAMEAAVATAMEEGAFGLSTSLQYVPDRFFTTDEIVALAKVAARYHGSYITHQRSESDKIDASLDEVFRVAAEARIPAQIYHLKTACKANWGRMTSVLRRIEEARASGLDVSADMYPYTAGENGLDANLPLWAREGSKDEMVARLRDPQNRAKIREELKAPAASWENQYLCCGGASGLLIASVVNTDFKKFEGKTLEQLGKSEAKDPVDVLLDLVIADKGNTANILFMMSEDDVRLGLRHPFVSMGTDSPAVAEDGIFSEEKSHPRAWGSATRILGRYVREEHLLGLEEAVRKMTSLPASRMGLERRGLLRPGMFADLVVFDPKTVKDRSTYEDPLHYSEGVPYVAVNGQLVVDGGKITAARPGRALMGPGFKPSEKTGS